MAIPISIVMEFYATKTPDGKIHIQNTVNGMRGQHHVHDQKSFDKWRANVKSENLHIDEGSCLCGLDVGQVKEYDGQVWFNDTFIENTGGRRQAIAQADQPEKRR